MCDWTESFAEVGTIIKGIIIIGENKLLALIMILDFLHFWGERWKRSAGDY